MAIITGDSFANLLNGTADADEISGLGGNDTLKGAAGNDTLTGGVGIDRLVGGGGNDTYIIDASDILVEATGIDTVRANFSYTLLDGFENLTLTGTNTTDGTGNSVANLITGNSAANTLSGGGDNDTLNGGSGDDSLLGGTGNDSLNGGSGNDTLVGGDGNDVLIYQAVDGSVRGDAGIDTLRINGSGVGIDLTVIANTVYKGLEVIDIIGSGSNMLTLARGDVVAFSSTTDTLRVAGNAGDLVATSDAGWLHTLNVQLGSQIYAQYTNGAAVLQVDLNVNRSGIDTTVPVMQLSGLGGTNGFRLDGIDTYDSTGRTVASAGDINGDGLDNLIIGASGGDPDGVSLAGECYVVYGKASGFSSGLSLSAINGANGFRLDGVSAYDQIGTSVASAGDMNGDGLDDVIVGAPNAAVGANSSAGESYVLFGNASGFASSIDLSALNGANGFRLSGLDVRDYAGRSVASAGDVNGDGFGDLIIGATQDPLDQSTAGKAYVVFGKASGFASNIDLESLNGANGFRLNGTDHYDFSGYSVDSAGDVNGDGFDDVIVGASGAEEHYLVFGKNAGFASSLDLSALNGTNGFRLADFDLIAGSVAGAGDVNGDGFGDLIIGAQNADPGGNSKAGQSYVVFGKAAGFGSSFALTTLDGTNGFRLDGIDINDYSGCSVSGAGDVNGDGFDDVIVGARAADPGGDLSAGESYVVFGRAAGFASSVDLGALNGADGFRLDGIDPDDRGGGSVSAAGDVNGDGFDDLIIGAVGADPGGDSFAGESYVVFGGDFTGAVTHLGTSGANALTGTAAAETFVAGQGNDTLNGGGGADVFNAGAGNDLIRVSSTTFRHVDGGSCTDTLRLLGAGRTLDLTTLANNKISGIEVIDITGGGDNTLELSKLDLLDLSDSTNQLTVDGNTGDTVNLGGTWSAGAPVGGYDSYTQGAATILVDADIDLFFV